MERLSSAKGFPVPPGTFGTPYINLARSWGELPPAPDCPRSLPAPCRLGPARLGPPTPPPTKPTSSAFDRALCSLSAQFWVPPGRDVETPKPTALRDGGIHHVGTVLLSFFGDDAYRCISLYFSGSHEGTMVFGRVRNHWEPQRRVCCLDPLRAYVRMGSIVVL